MKKNKLFILSACGLFIIGCSLLASIRNQQRLKPDALPIIKNELGFVVPEITACDEQIYPHYGVSEEKYQVMFKASDKPHGPEEFFEMLKDKETLHSILKPHNLPNRELSLITRTLSPHVRAKDLAAADLYRYSIKNGELGPFIDEFVLQKLDASRLPMTYRLYRRGDSAFELRVNAPIVVEEPSYIKVTVKGTLYQSFSRLEYGNELMQKLMSIFFWEMRMPEDVFSGDEISMLVNKKYALGEFIGYGRIEHAEYKQRSRTLKALHFSASDNSVRGYFDEQGRSLEREFSLSTTKENIATSHQQWRKHPVRKMRIRHNGVDYRGPGDFYSMADGEIIEKRYDENVGHMIRVRHNYGVHSEYFHAHSLDEKLLVGHRVKRGQRLGTIGRTGRLCTGPHLHLGVYTMKGDDRKYIELTSLRKRLKPMPDISAQQQSEFSSQTRTLMASLSEAKLRAASIVSN